MAVSEQRRVGCCCKPFYFSVETMNKIYYALHGLELDILQDSTLPHSDAQ